MKKVLMTAATLVVLLSTAALAQRYDTPNPAYSRQPGYSQPGYSQPNYNYDYDYDDNRFDRHLDWWDRELNLSRRQEREIRRIRDRFNQQSQGLDTRDPRQRDAFRQIRQRQFFDMMAVLGPQQRDQVIAKMRPYEQRPGGPRSASRGYDYRGGPGYGPNGY